MLSKLSLPLISIKSEKSRLFTTLRQTPLYQLHKSLNAKTGKAPSWNFTKILISKNGKETHVFSSNVEPDDLSILSKIEKLL